MRPRMIVPLLLAGALASCEGGSGGSAATVEPKDLVLVTALPSSAPAGAAVDPAPVVELRDSAGEAVADTPLQVVVELGGGALASAEPRTGADGRAALGWTLGRAPILNRIRVSAGAEGASAPTLGIEVRAEPAPPLDPEAFGDVHGYLEGEGIVGSTEDLAFDASGRLVMGVPGGLIAVAPGGGVSSIDLTGDPIEGPLGVALDRDGSLWVADAKGKALRHVLAGGEVRTALTTDGSRPLQAPNAIAIGPDGHVYLSDPCLGTLLRYDPGEDRVVAVHDFDLPEEGGPNGLAFERGGGRLWLATENTALLCKHSQVTFDAPIAGLYSIEIEAGGFGKREAVAEGVGLFGDGLAFDAEGNLYVVIDTQEKLKLKESAVWVLPAGEKGLRRLLSVSDRVIANVAFGEGDYGETTLYLALLAIPPFTPASARGVERVEIGVKGLPLLP